MLFFSLNIRADIKYFIIKIIFLLLIPMSSIADQYQSNELIGAKGKSEKAVKSISELEQELNTLTDDYSKDSTARYLARHYAQKNTKDSIKQAIEYYLLSLKGKGLSIYAKQATLLELLALYFHHKMYAEFIFSMDDYIALKGQISHQLKIKSMLAHYHLNKRSRALTLAKAVFKAHGENNETLLLEELNQVLFTFYNLKDYVSSAKVQRAIIAMDDNNVDQWLRLSKLLIKNNQTDEAAEVLLTALQKGVSIEQEDMLLLCDLLNQAGNPFLAARLMGQFLDEYRVDHNIENLDRLFSYWYLAQDFERAAEAKKASIEYDSGTERYLDLAQLYYQDRQWHKMNQVLKEACNWPLQDKYVSQANLLLGISELKLKNEAAAIEAFYNATMISGRVQEALAYLNYMNVDTSDTRRFEQITGVCAPVIGK